jgi:hypothetical protein
MVKNINILGVVVLASIAAGKVWNNQVLRSPLEVSLLISLLI